jgi:hypothetical protein
MRGGSDEAWEYPFWCFVLRREGPVHWMRVDAPAGHRNARAGLV